MQRRRRRSWAHGGRAASVFLLMMTPVPVPESDEERTGETSLTVGAGSGTYDREIRFQTGVGECGPITREAHFNADFTDMGAAVEHRTGRKGRVGVRAGVVRETVDLVPGQSVTVNVDSLAAVVDDTQNNFYVNPYAAAEGTWAGIGAGLILASEPLRFGRTEEHPPDNVGVGLSGHFRLGSTLYASASAGENVPIYSGGGYFNYGFGVQSPVGLDLWAGKALGPWREDELLLKAAVHPSRRWSVGASLRLRSDAPEALPGSDREYGLSVRVTRRFPDRRSPD